METLYEQTFHTRPSLEYQGSDALLGKLFKDVAKGSLSFYPLQKVSSSLPRRLGLIHKVTETQKIR
eukprot:1156600-Amphidinium_carterae.2